MPNARPSTLLVVGLALVAVACSPAASPVRSPGGSPGVSPGTSPVPSADTTGAIDYAKGATDLILQYEEGGGFMMVEWSLAQAPIFSLYGDGTIVFRDPMRQAPADANGLLKYDAFRTAKLNPEQMDQLLAFAVNDGGLATARDHYEDPRVADAGMTFFRLNAGGRSKEVQIYALMPDESSPDQLARLRFRALADRLRSFDQGGSIPTAEYAPPKWRAHLIEAGGQPLQVYEWPWPELKPTDFVGPAVDPNAPAFPSRIMSTEEIAAIGQGELKGGMMGYSLRGPAGKVYNLVIRPLLPHEEK